MLNGNYIIFECPVGNMERSCLQLKWPHRWCSVDCIYLPKEIDNIKTFFQGLYRNNIIPTDNPAITVKSQIARFGDPVLIKIHAKHVQYLFRDPDDKYPNQVLEFLSGANRSFLADDYIGRHYSTIKDTSSLQSCMEEFRWI